MSKNYLNYACRTAWLLAFAWPTLSFANETEVTGDPFVDIPASTSALKLLDDNGNDCHFAIDDPKSIDALSTQISKLYKVKPVKRGETLAWSIKNKKSSADQASKITVMITNTSNKDASLKMDRRKGGKGNNPLASQRGANLTQGNLSTKPPKPQKPPKTPPPAHTD